MGASSAALQSHQVPLNPAPEFAHKGRVLSPALSQSLTMQKLSPCASSNDSARLFRRHMALLPPDPVLGETTSHGSTLYRANAKKRPTCDARGATRATVCTPPPFEVRAQSPLRLPGLISV